MGHHICCNKQKVKRGLWSPEEDEKLVNYISTHGHGCWSSVPRLAGLQRCGKSCRLRWINYLRPDLKRGSFSSQEASLIIELHRILGNRWAQIARYLPGRTDNEVKNFWNSSIKKKLNISHRTTAISPHDLPTFPDLPFPICPFEGFFPLHTNPSFIPCPQQDQVYLPTQTSVLQPFDHGDETIVDQINNFDPNNLVAVLPDHQIPVLPPGLPNSQGQSSWSMDYQPQHLLKQEDQYYMLCNSIGGKTVIYYDPTVLPAIPKLSEVVKCSTTTMPSSSSFSHDDQGDLIKSLSCFPPGSTHPRDPHVPTNQMESIDAIISSILPSSSSSSSSSSLSPLPKSLSSFPSGSDPRDPDVPTNQILESIDAIISSIFPSSSLSPLANSQFLMKSNFPTSWDT